MSETLKCVGCKWYLQLDTQGDYCVDCANPYCNVCFYTKRHACDTTPGSKEASNKSKRLVKVIDILSKQPGFDFWWADLKNHDKLIELLEEALDDTPETP
jgi:hypothetical protein